MHSTDPPGEQTAKAQTPRQRRGEQKAKPHQTHMDLAPRDHPTDSSTLDVHHIALDLIDQGAQLIRADQNDDEIIELAADIAAHGLLQPIGVAPTPGGRYQLLFGARRLLAHAQLRRTTIPATLHTIPADSVRATAARENLLRRPLTLDEEIRVVCDLHDRENRSPEQIASLLTRSRAWVLRRLSVPQLPLDLREPLLDGVLSLGHAEALAQITDDGIRAYALSQVLQSTLSVPETKQMVAALRSNDSLAQAVQAGVDAAQNPTPTMELLSPCQACHRPRPLAQLAVVRVCADGCTAEDNTDDTPQRH